MNSKIILLSVAVVAVGLFALPSTMSLFSGQHTWYTGENVSCKKCHQDIYDEITSSSNQVHTDAGMAQNCEQCHRTTGFGNVGANITYGQWAGSDNYGPGGGNVTGKVNVTAHAAVTVECLACHGVGNTTYGRDKGLTGVAQELQGNSEAHRDFYYASVSDKDVGDINQNSLTNAGINTGPTWYTVGTSNQTVIKLKGTNTACIGCHTHAVVNITWRRSVGYGMIVDANTSTGKLDITSWSVNATKNTTNTSSE